MRLIAALIGRAAVERFFLRQRLVGEFGDRHAVREPQRRLNGIREPCLHVFAHDDAVHHNIDVVGELFVERRNVGDLVERAIDLHTLEALLHQLGEFLTIFALAAPHDRREQIESRPFFQFHHPVYHLGNRLALDWQAGGW